MTAGMTAGGLWVNDYGSRMALHVAADGIVTGRYASSTGSTGEYAVTGHAGPGPAGPRSGQVLALAISWHSLVPGPADASWDWCSGLSGQISLRDGGRAEMVLTHALVASSDFPGLARTGTHIDRLTYRPAGDDGAGPMVPPLPVPGAVPDAAPVAAPVVGPLSGTWHDGDGVAVTLTVRPDAGFDRLSGRLRLDGVELPVAGMAGRGAVRALSLTGRLPDGGVVCLAGSLPAAGGPLSLLDLTSHPTPPDSSYLQTRILGRRLQRA